MNFRAFPFDGGQDGTMFCLVEEFGEWRQLGTSNVSICETRRHLTREQIQSLHDATKAALEAADSEL